MPAPRVSVRNSVRNPISPRAGTRYSMRAQPVPWLTICISRPLRSANSCVTTPMYSSGTSLAPHQLDQDRELQLASPLHLPRIRARRREDAQRHVADELRVEPLLHLAR